jgi:hypothetical protein
MPKEKDANKPLNLDFTVSGGKGVICKHEKDGLDLRKSEDDED